MKTEFDTASREAGKRRRRAFWQAAFARAAVGCCLAVAVIMSNGCATLDPASKALAQSKAWTSHSLDSLHTAFPAINYFDPALKSRTALVLEDTAKEKGVEIRMVPDDVAKTYLPNSDGYYEGKDKVIYIRTSVKDPSILPHELAHVPQEEFSAPLLQESIRRGRVVEMIQILLVKEAAAMAMQAIATFQETNNGNAPCRHCRILRRATRNSTIRQKTKSGCLATSPWIY